MPLKLFLKAQLFTLIFLLIFLALTLLGGLGIGYLKLRQFTKTAGVSIGEVVTVIRQGWQQTPTTLNSHVNFLILGLDSLKTRGDVPPLTDTMMLVSLGLNDAQINTISFPRDLWHEGYKTRINALYFYGLDRYPDRPAQFPIEVLSEMTGVGVSYPVVVSFEQVSELIDLLGGVEVNVPVAFIDEEFPRTDVDVRVVKDPKLLFKTVIFTEGKQTLSGEKALEYMRSRKSTGDEGTDVARGARQQLVLDAVLAKLRQKDTITDPVLMGKLYRYYLDNFSQTIAPAELIAIAKKIWPVRNQFSMTNHVIKVFPEAENGTIIHPDPRKYQGEWIYTIREAEQFKLDVQTKLGLRP